MVRKQLMIKYVLFLFNKESNFATHILEFLKLKFYFLLVILLSFLSCKKDTGDAEMLTKATDSITAHIDSSKNKKIDFLERKENLQEAYNLINKIKKDSLKKPHYLDLVYAYYQLPDTSRFLELNNQVLELAKTTNDSVVIAKCYWRLGNFYSDIQNKNDSAFYYYNKGQEIYWLIGNKFDAARLLINMAIIQKNIKDYTGSEITTTKAIAMLKPLKGYGELYSSYNNLGIVFNELGEYDRAIYYHRKALEYIEKSGLTNRVPGSLNNIGVVYVNQKKYSNAIQNFEQGLEQDSLFVSDTELYAMLLDNLAYARFKSKDTTAELPSIFYKALSIRDSLQNHYGVTTSKLHLAEYFLNKNDTIKGIEYAREVQELSRQSNNFKDLLSSLLILSTADKDNALTYTNEYIKINDSLQKEERAIRNKFARIQFETDEYISKANRLNQQISQTSFISAGIILVIILLYIISNQRAKNKLIKQKQTANQEIYNLVIDQQKKFEEGRDIEKQYISRELHDGILGKLFGIRLNLDSLNEEDDSQSKKERFKYIREIQKISDQIRLLSHRLNKTSLSNVNFETVLEELIKSQNAGTIKFHIEFKESINWDTIDNNIKINIYRVLQEAISNIHKHSKATEARIEFENLNDQLIIGITDNGIGFSPEKTKNGIGLGNMFARVKKIKGKITISSLGENRKGTTIKLTVPFN
ncbi:tetratricopeptide repeat protein [Salegentibacter sp. LM13S]|uniref:tetratricopeptide repeat-containing sensor histidine kinase n=1 Tax=Salegentibacter lacus TaxID=2873599 RepID=UPI001CCBC72D|nr:tetratricopeptide repeat-containing sensor histidine kinase [Salegentibacter lacus]MBZ9632222.1 tetratricopeptide repeat protein [Salegentibacter lacus]